MPVGGADAAAGGDDDADDANAGEGRKMTDNYPVSVAHHVCAEFELSLFFCEGWLG